MLFKNVLEYFGDCDGIDNLIDLSQLLDVGGLVLKPAQVVCDEMHILAPRTLNQHHSLMVGDFREGPNASGLTLITGEHQDVQLASVIVFGAFDIVQDRHAASGVAGLDLLLAQLVDLFVDR